MVESSQGRIQQNGWELTWQDSAQRLRAHKLQVVRAIQMIRATAILCSYMCSQNTEFYFCHSAAVPSLTQQLQWSRWSLKWHIKWWTQQNETWKPLHITRITHRNSHSSCFWWGDWTKWSMSFCMVAKTCQLFVNKNNDQHHLVWWPRPVNCLLTKIMINIILYGGQDLSQPINCLLTKWSITIIMHGGQDTANQPFADKVIHYYPLWSYLVARTVNSRQNDPHHQLWCGQDAVNYSCWQNDPHHQLWGGQDAVNYSCWQNDPHHQLWGGQDAVNYSCWQNDPHQHAYQLMHIDGQLLLLTKWSTPPCLVVKTVNCRHKMTHKHLPVCAGTWWPRRSTVNTKLPTRRSTVNTKLPTPLYLVVKTVNCKYQMTDTTTPGGQDSQM